MQTDMKMKLTISVMAVVLLLLAGCKRNNAMNGTTPQTDSLKAVFYDMMASQPERALAFVDSLENEGVISEGLANIRRSQIYSEQFQPRVSEVYALRAVNDDRLKEESVKYYYFSYYNAYL